MSRDPCNHDQERKAPSAELYNQHLYGSCKFSDACHHLHQSVEEIQAKRSKRAEQQRGKGSERGGRGGKGGGKGGPPPPFPTTPTSPTKPKEPGGTGSGGGDEDPLPNCYQFMANGTCNFGEQCRFERMTADGRKVAKPARKQLVSVGSMMKMGACPQKGPW